MTAALRIKMQGVGTTVQDIGRFGHRQSGVPVSGPMDRIAFRLANALVKNDANAPALEMLVVGPSFEVLAESLRIAVAGGVTEIFVLSGQHERRIPAGRSVRLSRGDIVTVGPLNASLCGYLAIEGGIDVQKSLGSASTYTRSQLGGVDGRPLRTGDVLQAVNDDAPPAAELMLPEAFDPGFERPIRVVLGPQEDHFTPQAIDNFLSADYKVTTLSDRMGFRLQGAKLDHTDGYNILSDGILPGSIQVPGDGQPIILMADCQTTGGYPKIATVISSDLPLVARRRSGASIRFTSVTQGEAENIRREQEADLRQLIARFDEIAEDVAIDHDALLSANLIGGVISADE